MFVRSALFATVLGLGAGITPADATTVSGTYFEDTAMVSCGNINICQVHFPTLPSTLDGKFVRFEFLNCSLHSEDKIFKMSMFITDSGSNRRRDQYMEPPAETGTSSFSREVALKVAGGPPRRISLQFSKSTSTPTSATCNLVGTISTD